MPKGGRRLGAGRPKGTVAKSTAIALELREIMAKKLRERFTPILEAQMDSALGIQTEAFDRSTGKLYYKEPGPNVVAFKNIVEQVMGRPTESVQISGGMTLIMDI